MIRHSQPPADFECTTTEAHVRTVAEECDLPIVPAGPWLYTIRRVPILGAPIIYRCRVEVSS